MTSPDLTRIGVGTVSVVLPPTKNIAGHPKKNSVCKVYEATDVNKKNQNVKMWQNNYCGIINELFILTSKVLHCLFIYSHVYLII
jgi:hypothetical protein